MLVKDYAQDVNKTVEEIIELCKDLGIEVEDENTLLDDEKIIRGYTDNQNSVKNSQTSETIYKNPNYSKDDSKDISSEIGSQEPNDKEPSNSGSENKENEKIKIKKKKNENRPKADPPRRGLNSERVQMSRRDDNDNLDEDKIKIELNQQCKCYKNFLTVQYKPKYEFLDVFKLIVSDNTILFILPFCSKTDVNGFLLLPLCPHLFYFRIFLAHLFYVYFFLLLLPYSQALIDFFFRHYHPEYYPFLL